MFVVHSESDLQQQKSEKVALTVDEALIRIGSGRFQNLMLLFCGIVWYIFQFSNHINFECSKLKTFQGKRLNRTDASDISDASTQGRVEFG